MGSDGKTSNKNHSVSTNFISTSYLQLIASGQYFNNGEPFPTKTNICVDILVWLHVYNGQANFLGAALHKYIFCSGMFILSIVSYRYSNV